MSNQDDRLDFFNSVNKMISQLDEHEEMIVLFNNFENGEMIQFSNMDSTTLATLLADGIINHKTEQSKQDIKDFKGLILNTAYFLAMHDRSILETLKKGIDELWND